MGPASLQTVVSKHRSDSAALRYYELATICSTAQQQGFRPSQEALDFPNHLAAETQIICECRLLEYKEKVMVLTQELQVVMEHLSMATAILVLLHL